MSCGKPVEDDEEMPQAPIIRPSKCLRCKGPEVAIAIPKGPAYCKPCQLTTMELKFKRHIASLSTAECPRDSSALVACSEAQESSVLVDLLQNWLKNATVANERQPKHLLTSFEAAYVYDPEHQVEANAFAETFQKRHGVHLTLLPLSDIFKAGQQLTVDDLDAMDLPTSFRDDQVSPQEKLRALLNPLSPTSRASLTAQLRLQLLASYATSKGHAALLMGPTSTRLASHTLANIALGRGWTLGEEVASIYRHSKDIIVLRPLSSFLSHEVTFYVQTCLPSEEMPQQPLRKDNIDGLIQGFVDNLQANFPATISTIARTSEKLGLRSDLKQSEGGKKRSTCALCHLPSDLTAFEWPKTNSITDLASISENPTLSTPVQNASLLAPHLCYGCLVSLSERSKAPKETRQDVPLPEWMNDYLLAGDD